MYAIYIGSFNPVTKAHLLIAEEILKYTERCIFVPVSDLYGKASLKVKAQDRLAMLKLATNKQPRFEVNDIEIEMAKEFQYQNKTLTTLRLLARQYQNELAFVIGADNLLEIKNWYCYKELLSEFRLIVISRNNLDIEEYLKNDLELKELTQNAIILNEINLPISSQLVRYNVAHNLPIDELVDAEVQNYIEINNLYGGN